MWNKSSFGITTYFLSVIEDSQGNSVFKEASVPMDALLLQSTVAKFTRLSHGHVESGLS